MQANNILSFLKTLMINNNRQWFLDNKELYMSCKDDFEIGVGKAIARYSEFDNEIAHLQIKDCVYRFYRDVRFSPDKSPYKNHFGAYLCAHGKKALRGGYYIHMEPGHCLLAVGSYWLPTNILTSCRNEIIGNLEEWRSIVESDRFVKYFGKPDVGDWETSDKGFGIQSLKTSPKGFPKDFEFIDYLRMKDYCCWKRVPDTFFEGDNWLEESAKIFKTAKPMMDFMNSVIDDYE